MPSARRTVSKKQALGIVPSLSHEAEAIVRIAKIAHVR